MAFPNPQMMYESCMEEWGLEYEENKFIESEIEKYKAAAVKRFYIVADPAYAELVALTTVFGYKEGLKEAVTIVDELRLTDKHIAALDEDREYFLRVLNEERLEEKKYNTWMETQ